MKLINKLNLVILAVASLCLTASAQRGFDVYGVTRTLIVAPVTLYNTGAGPWTNSWVDVRSFDGIANLDVFCCTNVGNSTFTITVQGSNDQTNTTTIGSASVASSTTVIYTNGYYGGTNFSATNIYLLPGAIVTPTATTAGFATPYLNNLANPFTNSLSAYSPTQYGVTHIGLNIADANRYMRIIVTPAGAATNGVVGAILTAPANYTSYPF